MIKIYPPLRGAALYFALILLITLSTVVFAQAQSTPSGTVIVNRARLQYIEPVTNQNVQVETNTYQVTVSPMSIIRVLPDETTPYKISPNTLQAAVYDVCNDGNAPLQTNISRLAATGAGILIQRIYFDADRNAVFNNGDSPLTMGQTILTVAPNECAPVAVDFIAKNLPAETVFPIQITATALSPNSNGEDTGTRLFITNRGAVLSITKSVNGQSSVTAKIGDVLEYSVTAINMGEAPARNVQIFDTIQNGLYVADSLKLNNLAKTDTLDADGVEFTTNRVSALVPELAVGDKATLTFKVLVNRVSNGTLIVNTAVAKSETTTEDTKSNSTQAVIDPRGVVFNAEVGPSALIANSVVSLTDERGSLISLRGASAFPLNPQNANPFTASNGEYSFGLPCASGEYVLNAKADGFTSRRIAVTAKNSSNDPCSFEYSLTALDGMPLARPDGVLTNENVASGNMAGLFTFIPMFKSGAIKVLKSVDKVYAQPGDILTYRVEYTNTSKTVSPEMTLRDTLPRGFYIAEDSMRTIKNGSENKQPFTASGNVVSSNIGRLKVNEVLTLTYKVRIGADAERGKNTNLAVALDADGKVISDEGRASVEVRPGIDSDKQVLVGRVFIDKNGDSVFNAKDGDTPLSNAQIITSQGKSVLTDADGKYSLPAFPAGKTAVGLMRHTIPNGLLPKYGKAYDGDWSQLVSSPLGVGMIQTADFPLEEVKLTPRVNPNIQNAPRKLSDKKLSDKTPNVNPALKPSPEVQIENKQSSEKPADESSNINREVEPNSEASTTPLTVFEYIKIKNTPLNPTENVKIILVGEKENKTVTTGKSVISAGVEIREQNQAILLLNGEVVPATQIGEQIKRGGVMVLVYYNLTLKVGANRLEAIVLDSNGKEIERTTKEIIKGGKAVRFEIIPSLEKAAAGGRENMQVQVRAFDILGNPAEDSEMMLTTTRGSFRKTSETDYLLNANSPQKSMNLVPVTQKVVKTTEGVATVDLTSPVTSGTANLYLSQGYTNVNSENSLASAKVNFYEIQTPPTIIGFGELYFGSANPATMQMGKKKTFFAGRASLFGRVPLLTGVLTGAYQSNMPLNRDESFDKNLVNRYSFNDFNFDETYSVFGDSSRRFVVTPSNSKAYARWEKDSTFFQFGDFAGRQKTDSNALFGDNNQSRLFSSRNRAISSQVEDMESGPKLAAYNRNLTGLQIHLENKNGDLLEVAGARPDTAFGRDIVNPDFSRVKLSAADILFGSETVTLETRDRRTPEIIVKRESLLRDRDYEIDYLTGLIFLKNNITLFDKELNPNQLVISYEHKADKTSTVLLGRAEKYLADGKLKLGATTNYNKQAGASAYSLIGADAKLKLPGSGILEFEIARSQGEALGTFGNSFKTEKTGGIAVLATWKQKFNRFRTNFNFVSAQDGFNNPYGGIIQRGSTRAVAQVEADVTSKDALRLQLSYDRTATENFKNSRTSAGLAWKHIVNDKLSTILGYDFRNFRDSSGQFGNRSSHIVTAGVNWNPTNRLSFSVVREQNLGKESDPAYPNNTLLSAEYRLNQWSKFFATNRFGGQITPTGDSSQIVAYQSKREFNTGFETNFKQGTSLLGSFRNEDGQNGRESFAVAGIGQKWNITKNTAIDAGYQFAHKLAGESLISNQKNYHNLYGGVTYSKANAFTSTARYEFRNRLGRANLFSTGIAGKLNEDWTVLGKFSFATADQTFDKSLRTSNYGQIGAAFRPKNSDKYGLLMSAQMRDFGYTVADALKNRTDSRKSLTMDGYFQATPKLTFFGKTGLTHVAQTEGNSIYSTWMTLTQGRAEYLLGKKFDVGTEARWIQELKTNSARFGGAAEVGFWVQPQIRIAAGYNYQQKSNELFQTERTKGFYVTITTKLDRFFNIFGSGKASSNSQVSNPVGANNEK